ncbi:MAG TPA: VWA domain-containing protein [Bryobacteraceae bacterium]
MKPAVFVFLAAAVWAQEPRFRARVHEVIVPVSVTAKAGKPVESLTASDFIVLTDEKPQAVRMISRDSDALPVYAVIVLEVNDASEPALAKIRKTGSVISNYITNDMETGSPSLAAVVTASDEVRVAQDFTPDPDVLEETFKKVRAAGDAGRLLDAVSLACDMLAVRKEQARRVIVLISESRDRQSKAHFADVAGKAQKNDVAVYTVSYSAYTTAFTQKASDRQPLPDEPGLYDPTGQAGGGMNLLAIGTELARLAKVNIAEALAQASGGGHSKFTTLHGLETQLSAIGTEIHNRYLLTFVPPEPQPAGYHRLSVSVRNPGDWRVHARAGYWTLTE